MEHLSMPLSLKLLAYSHFKANLLSKNNILLHMWTTLWSSITNMHCLLDLWICSLITFRRLWTSPEQKLSNNPLNNQNFGVFIQGHKVRQTTKLEVGNSHSALNFSIWSPHLCYTPCVHLHAAQTLQLRLHHIANPTTTITNPFVVGTWH